MTTNRLEAFSDGVIAILITIMVLSLHEPDGGTLGALTTVLPTFLAYILSFAALGIYWNNHHHLFQATRRVNGRVLWANLHLLFWLSLVPFVTTWMGENPRQALPTAIYGLVLLLCAVAYTLLFFSIMALEGRESVLGRAVRSETKERISIGCYVASVPMAFVNVWISRALFVVVALVWLIPDTRIERQMAQSGPAPESTGRPSTGIATADS